MREEIRLPRSKKYLIIETYLSRWRLTRERLFVIGRNDKLKKHRYKIWFELKQAGYPLKEIARVCRPEKPYHHTTIMHGIWAYEDAIRKGL
jgi:hypothetical protein